MNHFTYKNGILHCEDKPVQDIAKEIGTPFYLYSTATLQRHFGAFNSGFTGMKHQTCFAVKACSNLSILNIFAKMGGGADIVSGGELFRAMKAGIDPQKIIYSGVGKTRTEIRESLEADILMFNVESPQELDRIQEIAAEMKITARIAFRINPDVNPKTHAYISTGLA
ncbi:MAG: diaminopimelate decarboxylase, partial [Candidatus Electrothrix sp. GM3_4]|nr:diaminopimelate decarboxylase [Candidatus Electrothrix sp. GM3_4]